MAKELFLFLIQPVLERIKSKRLVIIPHEELNYIPFQIFLNPADGRFLGERFQISYAPSASILLGFKRSSSLSGGRLLAVADPDIPFAVKEVKYLAELFPEQRKVETGDIMPRECDVKTWARDYDIVHLSVHGKFNEGAPMLSYLKLGEGGGDDGKLTAAEMYGLPLDKSRLVVLSACETGKTQATHGNEILGMMRGLLFAGANSSASLKLEGRFGSHRAMDADILRERAHPPPARGSAGGPCQGQGRPEICPSPLLGRIHTDREVTVADFLQELNERIKALGGDWSKYSVIGSFLLYVIGYLALRFHLTVIGVGTDLAVIDERYLFTGARFLVFLVTTVPIIVLFALPVALIFRIVCKLLPETICAQISGFVMQQKKLVVFGIVYSVVLIQCVMVKCFDFCNLLIAPHMPVNGGWLSDMLLDGGPVSMNIYFAMLMAASAVPIAIFAYIRKSQPAGSPEPFLRGLLAFLAMVQILMLPVNYGVLVVDLSMPRVSSLGDKPLANGEDAWLAWEGKEGVTFLVRNRVQNRRSLVTLARADVKRMEIIGSDKIIPALFQARQGGKR